MGSSVFSNAASFYDRSRNPVRTSSFPCCCSMVFVPSVSKFAHATVSNTARSNISQLVWESCHSHVVPCQECSPSVEGASFIPYAGFFNLAAIYGG